MARARNIKPGFFKNEDLAECSAWARLCYIGLWTLADREGRLEDRPKRVKGELFAFDTVDVEPLLVELAGFKFILRYSDGARNLIQIVKFRKHQNPHHKEPPSVLASPQSLGLLPDGMHDESEAIGPSDDDEASDKPGASPRLLGDERAKHGGKTGLIPDSGYRIPESGREEGAAALATPPPPKPKTKKTKPPEVTLAEWLDAEKAAERKAVPADDPIFGYADQIGLPREFLHLAWAEFKARYTAEPVKGERAKTYTDWRAVFRKAVREGWLKLWFVDGQQYALTTAGQQAQRVQQTQHNSGGGAA